jgi:hypothetical protein
MNPFSFNVLQLLAQVPVNGAVGVMQPALQFPCINPRATMNVNSTVAATVGGTLFVGPTANGPWTTVGTFSMTSTGSSNTNPPDSGAPANCPGVWWAFEITSATGDTSATVDFYLEG